MVPSEEGPHRKYYGLNDHGRSVMALSAKTWIGFAQTMDHLLSKGSGSMSATTASTEVGDYLAAVSRELADLPAAERDDLLEDLDSHLHEVIAEGEGSLEQRLGPPEQYAAELRASAGLTSSDRSTAGVLHRAISSLSASTDVATDCRTPVDPRDA